MIPSIELSNQVLDLVRRGAPFAIEEGAVTTAVKQPLIEIAELFSQAASQMALSHSEIVPHASREQLRYITDTASSILKKISDPALNARKIAASLEILSAKLGVPSAVIDPQSNYYRFVMKNHIHHKNQSVGIVLGDAPAIKIAGVGIVPWTDLLIEQIDTGYTFFYRGTEVFRTDANFELPRHNYIYTVDGIIHQDPRNNHINRFDHDPSHIDRYTIEVWTMVDNPKIPAIKFGGNNHAWLVLKDSSGDIYSIGRSGPRKMSLLDAISPFGKKAGGIETPDYGSQMPRDAAEYLKTSFSVSQEQFETLMARVKHDKEHNSTHVVSMLQSNCTSYVNELLNIAGIRPETRIHPMSLLASNLLPSSIGAPIAALFNFTTEERVWWKYGLHFFPPIYAINLLFGLFIKCLSLFNKGGCGADLALHEVFLKPWKIYVDHPHALAQWQKSQNIGKNHE